MNLDEKKIIVERGHQEKIVNRIGPAYRKG